MPEPLDFQVRGMPVQEGSFQARIVKGRAYAVPDNDAALRRWRKAIVAAARVRMEYRESFAAHVPVRLLLLFEIGRPRSVTRSLPSVRPDLDKLARAVGDALTDARVWVDDGQVVSLRVDEVYSDEPGVRVRVEEVEPARFLARLGITLRRVARRKQ